MKHSVQVTVTPLLLDALSNAVAAMKLYHNDEGFQKAAEADGLVGEIHRASITNMQLHRAILKTFSQVCEDNLADSNNT